MATVHAYIHFDGDTEAAFNFYKSVFGGEFLALQRYKDIPPDLPAPSEPYHEKIMHIALLIGNSTLLMGSDRPSCWGKGIRGDNFHISIVAGNEQEAKNIFQKLAEGGKINMPLEKAFWGASFGMLTDKFGIQWMVNHNNENFF